MDETNPNILSEHHLMPAVERADGIVVRFTQLEGSPDVFAETDEAIWRYGLKDVSVVGYGNYEIGLKRIREAYARATPDQLQWDSPILLESEFDGAQPS